MSRTFGGSTQDAQSLILGAKHWKKGMQIKGSVTRNFETTNGICYEIVLEKPITLNGKSEKKVSIGALKGFHMALNAAGLEELETGDKIAIECTGVTATDKGNPRVDFKVAVIRD
jgi:hypothetical protein